MLQLDQVIGDRYQLRQRLGQNAGRQTWLAIDQQSQALVVVKLLTFSDQVQWEDLRLFEREAHILKHLHHPRIPSYRDYFRIDDRLLWFGLVQDYIPGRSLKQAMVEGDVLTEAELRIIAANILNILVYLHSLNPPVLHRDIKPSNLIWGEDDYIYLIDFGAVQDRAAREGATFTVVGTFGYAPLEQFGGRATPASDLYALGATLIHLATGIAPADLPQQDGRLQFAHLTQLNPGLVRWLSKLTEPNLSDRYKTARAALSALQANELAISTSGLARPENCSIHLVKSPERLAITIPGLKPLHLLTPKRLGLLILIPFLVAVFLARVTAGIVLFKLFQILGVPLMILAIASFLLLLFGKTTLTFDGQHFEIITKGLGVYLRRQRGKVADIDKVFCSDTKALFGAKASEVTLAAGVQEYSIGRFDPPLTETECVWLVDEIRSWLGIGQGDRLPAE